MKIEGIRFAHNTASAADIESHFHNCPDVYENLCTKLSVPDYSAKLRTYSETFEAWNKDGQLVGLVACYANDAKKENAFISNVSICPVFRGKHISRELLDMTLNFTRDQSFHRICLEVNPYNTMARNLYATLGFRDSTIREQSIIMEKVF